MAWQQSNDRCGPETSTTLGKVNASLNGLSYIIAFFLVDALTFGQLPATPLTSPSEEKGFFRTTARSSSSNSLPRRSASEGDENGKNQQQRLQRPSRGMNSSESTLYDWKQSEEGSEKDFSPRLSPNGSTGRSLHHFQKKLFARQVEKTLTVQPFIKCLVISLTATLFFVLYAQIFGIPGVLKMIIGAVFASITRPLQYMQTSLLSLYGILLAATPLPRRKKTGWDMLLSILDNFWNRISLFIHGRQFSS